MTPAALQQFNALRLDVQYALFPAAAQYGNVNFTVCHTAVKSNKSLRDGGFRMAHDFIARARKSELVDRPKEETDIVIGGRKYRISEVVDHPISGEWRLGLRSSV